MFSVFGKLVEKLGISFNFLNRDRSPSFKTKQVNTNGDNVSGDKIIHIHNRNESKPQSSPIIICWSTTENHIENSDIITYEFDTLFQNKGGEILEDFWVNFSSSGFKLELERTNQTPLFEGWNVFDQSIQLITKGGYRFAPKNFLNPFKVRITLNKKKLPKEAWLYFSFGAKGVPKVEQEGRAKENELQTLMVGKRGVGSFLRLLKLGK